jgi:hypothetical protein
MKIPKTKFVVISAIGLASIVGIFVSAQSPVPSTSDQDLPVHLVMACAKCQKAKLQAALKPRPSPTYRWKYDSDPPVGTLPESSPPPCGGAHAIGNATQKGTFANTKELRAFLDAAGF